MAKITVCGDAVVITSALKLEDIKFIQKYRKGALTLMGGEDGDEPIFRISVTNSGCGSINQYGAEFASQTHDEQGLATLTVVFRTDGDVKEVVADTIGQYVVSLNKLEAQIPSVLTEITNERQAIMDSITFA